MHQEVFTTDHKPVYTGRAAASDFLKMAERATIVEHIINIDNNAAAAIAVSIILIKLVF